MDPAETRVPEVPDQGPFLAVWFDYHRGYRIERSIDGSERKVELQIEKPWRDVDPGELPLRNWSERRMTLRTATRESPQETLQVSLDSTLDHLLEQADDGSEAQASARIEGHDADADERRRQADEKAIQEALERLNAADRTLSSATLRKQRAACELQAAERALQASQITRRTAAREHQQAQELYQMLHRSDEARAQAAQRLARVFGTREDIERQGAEYVSPLTDMFTRAYERFRTAEEVRAQERESAQNSERHREFLTEMVQQQYPALFHTIQDRVDQAAAQTEPLRTLDDEGVDRPEPKNDEELIVKLQCRVCLTQMADTACLPCGHLVMCIHCADILIPTRDNDATAPAKKSSCPLCRKHVNRRVRVFVS